MLIYFNITLTLSNILELKAYLLDIWIRSLCDSIDLKTEKPFVLYLCVTWIMIGKIVGDSRICSIICITQNTLFPFALFQISFCYIS